MPLTRRGFVVGASAVAVAGAASLYAARGAIELAAPSVRDFTASNVVAFFRDQLWLDPSGLSAAYHPPLGARGAAPLAALTDDELSNLYGRI